MEMVAVGLMVNGSKGFVYRYLADTDASQNQVENPTPL
jgi:hypothetical protein